MGLINFFKKSFSDMKESAKAQHEVDKANFSAAKAESHAGWEEAKAMGDPKRRGAVMQAKRDEQIAEANERKAAAEARIDAVRGNE
ncbi:MAG: hypothetical protein IKB38_02825 [Clostridia bacterium]|nr:hypothetical protein [Clostridia bacterium]